MSRGGKHAAPASPAAPVEVVQITDVPVRLSSPGGSRITVGDRVVAESLVRERGYTLAD